MPDLKLISLDLPERMRMAAVRQLREFADALERAPRERLADILLRLPLGQFQRDVGWLLESGRFPSVGNQSLDHVPRP